MSNEFVILVAIDLLRMCQGGRSIVTPPARSRTGPRTKGRAAELRDEALFMPMPPKEDCPISFLPIPYLQYTVVYTNVLVATTERKRESNTSLHVLA